MIPFMNYQRLFVGLLPSSYLRSSYHRMLRRVIYLCIGITLLLFLCRLLQCNHDNKFTGRVSISPDPWSKTRFTHISDNGNINYHHSNNKIKQQIAGVATTKTNYVYGVVFDAGSTGSRVHIFKLVHNPLDPFKPFKLLDDKYHHVQPGLSSYAEKPEEAALSLTKLINIAETSLPVDVCRNTPVILRATAGLRLISAHKAENILKAVCFCCLMYYLFLSEGVFCEDCSNLIVGFMSQLKLDHHRKPGSTGRFESHEVGSWMRTAKEESRNRTKWSSSASRFSMVV
ncbi:Ectonucleoside triphosphate diphosphohydrolase 5, variant 2 [Schistosoma haematobium]|uniref:Ectonucleoside triphosphate diphosphohydrolase 5, variant 2 n=1 Tax=Schistosoma haematobium TaxID=6185 RepID=A0A922S465_SCHHA|nr:Ectonucleoside triphosphate diphosphohydrolase 5, variant 2 [Schistosoma haematobium]KAH9592848.1 Ectonucleoside triphosphate diphosphohydrolase 5, variant 2 [Schistosoma haematobium]